MEQEVDGRIGAAAAIKLSEKSNLWIYGSVYFPDLIITSGSSKNEIVDRSSF